jgi:lipoprotein NlpI
MVLFVLLTLFQDGDTSEALSRARLGLRAGQYEEAVKTLRDLAKKMPDSPEVFDMLGTAELMVGQVAESCRAFDRQIRLRPVDGPGHWRRGISLYYAGRYAEGQKQFEDYQSVDGNDVENTVWKLMCQTRAPGQSLEKAQKEMLPIGLDRRIPMMKVLDLFAGKAKPGEVEQLAQKTDGPQADSAKFYGNLYLGLWEDLQGHSDVAAAYLEKASKGTGGSEYMRDVGKVHLMLLKDKKLPWQKP